MDGVEDEVLLIDDAYRIRFANAAAHKGTRRGGSPAGQYCYHILHGRNEPCHAPLWDCPLSKALQSGRAVSTVHPAPPGTDTYLKITAYPILDEVANTKAVMEIRRDVTAERKLEAQILRRHHQLSALSHISSAISGPADLETTLKLALENVLEIISGAMGGILLLDEKTKTLSYRIQRGLPASYIESRPVSSAKASPGG